MSHNFPQISHEHLLDLISDEAGSAIVVHWANRNTLALAIGMTKSANPRTVVVTRGRLLDDLKDHTIKHLLFDIQCAADNASRWVAQYVSRPEAQASLQGADAILTKTVAYLETVLFPMGQSTESHTGLSQNVSETATEVLFFIATGKTWEEDLVGFGEFAKDLMNRLAR